LSKFLGVLYFLVRMKWKKSWEIVTPIVDAWAKETDIASYPAGTLDIPEADALLDECEGGWRDLRLHDD